LVVVNELYCKSTTTLSHEIAHNLGLQHSGMGVPGNAFDDYADQTGLMGYSDDRDDANMCFNAPKSHQLGWYSSRDVTLDSSSLSLTTIDDPWTADLVGVADYGDASVDQVVTVKLDTATNPYYIGFNRKTGIHADTNGPADKVLVSYQEDSGQSWRVAALDAGQVYDLADYFGPGEDARIEVLGYTMDEPRVAQVAIYPLGSCSQYEYEFALDLETDGYASETSWDLKDASGNVVLSGSGYSDLETYAKVECLPAGAYTFNLYDTYRDGIDKNHGGYTITLDGRAIAAGNEFQGSTKSHTFEAGCADNLSLFELDLTTDQYAYETSWEVKDVSGDLVVTSGQDYADSSTNYASFCLPDGEYTFTIFDSDNDGICCGVTGDGSYTVYNQKEQIGTGGSFTDLDTYDFVVDVPTPVEESNPGDDTTTVVEPTFCADDISLKGVIGSVSYDSLPIKIISQDTTSVTIEVSNTWSEDVVSNMFTRYDDVRRESTCHELTQVTKTDTERYTITCMFEAPVAHVDIFVADDTFSESENAAIPQCCHPQDDVVATNTAQYTFMLQCVSQCPTEGMKRQLLRGAVL
jgi:hypothetical protein